MMTYKRNNAHDTFLSPAVFPGMPGLECDGIVAIGEGYGSRPGFSQQQSVIGPYGIIPRPSTTHPTASPARTRAAKRRAALPRRSKYSIHSSRGRVAPGGIGINRMQHAALPCMGQHSPRETSFTSATQAQAKVSVKPQSGRNWVKVSGHYFRRTSQAPSIPPVRRERRAGSCLCTMSRPLHISTGGG